MKADIVGNGWAEFKIKVLLGIEPHDQTIIGRIVAETEYTVTVEYLWDGVKQRIVLEK